MDLHQDFRDLLAEFVRGGVRFALLGSTASLTRSEGSGHPPTSSPLRE